MKLNLKAAIARHCAEVYSDPKTKPEDAATARAILGGSPLGEGALEGLDYEALDRLIEEGHERVARLQRELAQLRGE